MVQTIGSTIWTDGRRRDGRTIWASTTQESYSNWRIGQPDMSENACIEVYLDGQWGDEACRESRPCICECERSLCEEGFQTSTTSTTGLDGDTGTTEPQGDNGSTVTLGNTDATDAEGNTESPGPTENTGATPQGDTAQTLSGTTTAEQATAQTLSGTATAEQATEIVNECLGEPCKNGGTCIDEEIGYRCICTEGYLGTQCNVHCVGNSCYIMMFEPLSRDQAAQYCKTIRSGYIVDPGDSVENDMIRGWVQSNAMGSSIWTNLKRLSQELSNYNNFRIGEPDIFSTNSCIEMYWDGQWGDTYCGELKPYICECTRHRCEVKFQTGATGSTGLDGDTGTTGPQDDNGSTVPLGNTDATPSQTENTGATPQGDTGDAIDSSSLFVDCPSDYVPRTQPIRFSVNGSSANYKTCDVTLSVEPGAMAADSVWTLMESSSSNSDYEAFVVTYEEVICQGQGSVSPTCRGGLVLSIVDANYGRTKSASYVCPTTGTNDDDTSCVNADSKQAVKTACDGQTYCSFVADTATFSDSCATTHKYLNITYQCVNP